jgi:type IV pilus assembly protein PilM
MSLLSGGQTDFFGLDIGSLGLRAVQLRGRSPKSLVTYGQVSYAAPLESGEAAGDKQIIQQAIKQLLQQTGISTKNVAVNLPSHRVFTTLVDIEKVAGSDIKKSLRYQAGSFIPTPLDKSKIDWTVLGPSAADPKKVEVLLSSVSNDYSEVKLDLVESTGLNVIAMEPDNMALARALIQAGSTGALMILDIGYHSSDVIIAVGEAPRLARSIPTATSALVRAATQSLNIDNKQAEQYIFKFGLGRDKLEGRVYGAIITAVDSLMAELDKSIKFFRERYPNVEIGKVVVSGAASIIPELPLYVANHLGVDVEIGNSWRNVNVPAARQNELMANSNHFAVAAGLAEREV